LLGELDKCAVGPQFENILNGQYFLEDAMFEPLFPALGPVVAVFVVVILGALVASPAFIDVFERLSSKRLNGNVGAANELAQRLRDFRRFANVWFRRRTRTCSLSWLWR